MSFELDECGTLLSWKPSGLQGRDVFSRRRQIGGSMRGGGHICCPIFGPMPNTEDYAGLKIPQHGDPRTGQGHRHRTTTFNPDGSTEVNFCYLQPWPHFVRVHVREIECEQVLEHTIEVHVEKHLGRRMPLSVGFHPYFATYGKPFRVYRGDISDPATIPRGKSSHYLPSYLGVTTKLVINGGHTIEITLDEGYRWLCLWSDNKTEYMCVEPVSNGEDGYGFLNPGEVATHRCTMRVI